MLLLINIAVLTNLAILDPAGLTGICRHLT
jgi:hypothetical protein